MLAPFTFNYKYKNKNFPLLWKAMM